MDFDWEANGTAGIEKAAKDTGSMIPIPLSPDISKVPEAAEANELEKKSPSLQKDSQVRTFNFSTDAAEFVPSTAHLHTEAPQLILVGLPYWTYHGLTTYRHYWMYR